MAGMRAMAGMEQKGDPAGIDDVTVTGKGQL
jgi:hypothetical protein